MNSYKEVAENPDIDLAIHLGDWLYLPPSIVNLDGQCKRVPRGMCYTGVECDKLIDAPDIPTQGDCDPNDNFRLSDMRYYHKVLNTDVDVRALRAAHPIVLLPDNHDINDDLTVSPATTTAFLNAALLRVTSMSRWRSECGLNGCLRGTS